MVLCYKKTIPLVIVLCLMIQVFSGINVNAATVKTANVITPTSSEKLSFTPSSIIQDTNDTVLYMTDYNNKRVVAYNYITKEMSYVQFQLQPENITMANGKIYVCLLKGQHDSNNLGPQQGAIGIIDAATFKTSSPAVKEQFDIDFDPYGIAVDNSGNIYISGGSAQWTELRCYSEVTKNLVAKGDRAIYEKTKIKFDAANNRIYYYTGYIGAYHINNGQILFEGERWVCTTFDTNNFCLSSDGKYIFTGLSGIYRAGTDKYDDRLPLPLPLWNLTNINNWKLNGFAFNSDDNLFYTTHDKKLYAYDYKSFNQLCSYDLDNNGVELFYKNNNLIALTTDDNNIFYIEVMGKPLVPNVPYLIASSIEDGSMNVPLTNDITLTFNQNMHLNDNNSLMLTDEKNNKIDITPTFESNKLTIKLNNGMDYNKVYKLKIDTSAIASDDNSILASPISIIFHSKQSKDDSQGRKYINKGHIIINMDSTIDGDMIINTNTYLIIENGAKLNVTGNVINYGAIVNYGQLIANGSIYCASTDEYTPDKGIELGSLINKGTVNKNITDNYPEPYNVITPNSGFTTDKGSMDFTVFYSAGISMLINNKGDTDCFMDLLSVPCQLKIGDNNINVEIKDYLGHTYDKSILVHCTAKPLNVLKVDPIDFTTSPLQVNQTFYVQFDDEIQAADNFRNITISSPNDYTYNMEPQIVADSQGKNTLLKLTCNHDCKYSTSYTINIPYDAVKGSNNQFMSKNYSTNFTTDKEFTRLAGSNRFATAVEISKNGWNKSKTVVLATGETFPDALAAAPLAAKYDAPILLTETKRLTSEVKDEIQRLDASSIIIIGGTGAVSKDVENELLSMGLNCRRVFGSNRFDTSVAIAKELDSSDTVVIATGLDFPDALSIAPFAAAYRAPILLTNGSIIPDCVRNYIKDNNVKHTLVIGGAGIISEVAKNSFPDPIRLAGANRYETNFKIISAMNADLTYVYFATGLDFPDALSGAPLAAYSYSPVILVDKGMDKNVLYTWQSYKNELKMKYILGGTGAVSQGIIDSIFK